MPLSVLSAHLDSCRESSSDADIDDFELLAEPRAVDNVSSMESVQHDHDTCQPATVTDSYVNQPGPSGTRNSEQSRSLFSAETFVQVSDSDTSEGLSLLPLLPTPLAGKLNMLREMFPNYSSEQIEVAVTLCMNDIHMACQLLLNVQATTILKQQS